MNAFLHPVYKWYSQNHRKLPWRETTDPYKIWISEIILQQTRVDQGILYYLRFIEKFPTITVLAEAGEDEVLKLWQGLGYYSRARNLHAAAREISEKYDGVFPANYAEILQLKGIGPYTAAAVSSMAFGLPYPALDGNIYRVLARYFGISSPPDTGQGKKDFLKIAGDIMPAQNPGFHNQALMEFGALQCIPKSPDCSACPVVSTCHAANHKQVKQLPVKSKKAKQRNRYFYYYFIDSGNSTWLEKRTGNDIWKNLYQFPLVETEYDLTEQEILNLKTPFLSEHNLNLKSISTQKKHVLSHQVIYARLIHLEINNNYRLSGRYLKISKKDISAFAVPRLIEILMEKTEIFKIK